MTMPASTVSEVRRFFNEVRSFSHFSFSVVTTEIESLRTSAPFTSPCFVGVGAQPVDELFDAVATERGVVMPEMKARVRIIANSIEDFVGSNKLSVRMLNIQGDGNGGGYTDETYRFHFDEDFSRSSRRHTVKAVITLLGPGTEWRREADDAVKREVDFNFEDDGACPVDWQRLKPLVHPVRGDILVGCSPAVVLIRGGAAHNRLLHRAPRFWGRRAVLLLSTAYIPGTDA